MKMKKMALVVTVICSLLIPSVLVARSQDFLPGEAADVIFADINYEVIEGEIEDYIYCYLRDAGYQAKEIFGYINNSVARYFGEEYQISNSVLAENPELVEDLLYSIKSIRESEQDVFEIKDILEKVDLEKMSALERYNYENLMETRDLLTDFIKDFSIATLARLKEVKAGEK